MKNNIIKYDKKKYEIDGLGNKFKNSIETRSKKSKFAAIIKNLNDDELKALCIVLFGKNNMKEAVDCYLHTVEHGVQIYSLENEAKKRGLL